MSELSAALESPIGLREKKIPGARQVVQAIARRELAQASKRKLVRLLFLFSVLPPLVLTIVIIVKMIAEQATGTSLDWDPVLRFLHFQVIPVALLALGLGTPIVARDRSENVLFLYATRPVLPWHYSLGKMLAVAIPSSLLLIFPGFLIAAFRASVTGELASSDAAGLVARITLASLAMGWGFAGATVGTSAATRRSRWSLLFSLAIFMVLDVLVAATFGDDGWPVGPVVAMEHLLGSFFGDDTQGLIGFLVLVAYGFGGFFLTNARVRKEMIP